ncbi:MAG: hypothetical protein G5663_01970 [Serratia symbiotica]|nr:hypothetical protein [Serratia symbiotica]
MTHSYSLVRVRPHRIRVFQTLAQLVVKIIVGVQHARRVGITKVRTALHHFDQRKRLLFDLAL